MEKPKIRFRKFNNKWKKNKLDKVVDFFDNQRIPIDSSERKSGPYPYYGASGIIDYVDGYIFSGEYVLLAEDGANIILRSSPIAYLSKGKFWLNNHAHIMRMKTGSNEFLIQLLEKQNYEKYNTGTAQPKLNGEVVKNITLHFPSDDEQSAIGSLFRTLDDLLASYKDNLANYQSLKATMLSKMFPKAGQTVPEIRIDGFEGEWEIKRADEIFKSVSEKNRASLPVLSASQIDGMVLRDEIGIDIKYDEATLNNYKVVKPGQFVIHLRSFQGGFALSKLEGITSPAYTIIDFIDKENNLPDFWNSILTSRDFIKRLETVTYGIRDGKSISFKDFSSLKFVFPNFKEQQAIGSYFSNLDNLINSHQEKISQLETLKKKLLQDMFL